MRRISRFEADSESVAHALGTELAALDYAVETYGPDDENRATRS